MLHLPVPTSCRFLSTNQRGPSLRNGEPATQSGHAKRRRSTNLQYMVVNAHCSLQVKGFVGAFKKMYPTAALQISTERELDAFWLAMSRQCPFFKT